MKTQVVDILKSVPSNTGYLSWRAWLTNSLLKKFITFRKNEHCALFLSLFLENVYIIENFSAQIWSTIFEKWSEASIRDPRCPREQTMSLKCRGKRRTASRLPDSETSKSPRFSSSERYTFIYIFKYVYSMF